MPRLPEEFLTRMKSLLGTEYDAFLASYDHARTSGLRVNTLKCTPEHFAEIMRRYHITTSDTSGKIPRSQTTTDVAVETFSNIAVTNQPMFTIQDSLESTVNESLLQITSAQTTNKSALDMFHPIPWVSNGFFILDGIRMSTSPLYAAGIFYLQEPSAMTPASRLPITPGERVLDLCAAPGGKATELAARLKGQGLLVANDISNARAKALLRNLELFGAPNIFVTNETPGNLADVFDGFFDKILVDAPCSGEGMFRKDESTASAWTPDKPAHCAKLQQDILKNAVRMLREGGIMLYSTCTFAPEEDEGSISWLLENFPEMHLLEMDGYEGFAPGRPEWGNGNPELAKCVRIWPHRMNGEGHFLALLMKDSEGVLLSESQTRDNDSRTSPLTENQAFLQNDNSLSRLSNTSHPLQSETGNTTNHQTNGDTHAAGKIFPEETAFTHTESLTTNKTYAKNFHQDFLSGKTTAISKKKGKKRTAPHRDSSRTHDTISKEAQTVLEEFFSMVKTPIPIERLELHGERVFLSPELPSGVHRLQFLRNGLYLGDLKKNRFEPSQPFAMTLSAKTFSDCLNLRLDDGRIEHFLRGETISVETSETRSDKGWNLVCVEGFSLGWGKLVNGILKNKYPSGWRH